MSSESGFLKDFFSSMDGDGVEYAILRNAGNVPVSLGGSDLDILVSHTDFEIACRRVAEAAKRHGGAVLVNRRMRYFCQFMLLGKDDGCWWGACVDLFDGVTYRDTLNICAPDALSRRVRNSNGMWTFDDETAHLIGYAKEWLVNGKKSLRYGELARRAIRNGKSAILHASLAREVGKALAAGMTSRKRYIFTNCAILLFRNPLVFLKGWMRYHLGRMFRYARPAGSMIAVLGTDGSGKSTLLESIVPLLNQAMHGQLTIHHLRPDLLPPLGRFRGVKYEPGHVCTTPHASRPSGFVGSMLRIVYLLSDYVAGYWIRVRPKLAKIPTGSWIFDRYAYDMLIDSRRFRICLPNWIIKTFLCFVPRPDLILCLGGNPEKIYARKPETSLEEVKRQVATLKKFCDGNCRAVWIDTTTSIEASRDAMLAAITEKMRIRYE